MQGDGGAIGKKNGKGQVAKTTAMTKKQRLTDTKGL